MANSTTLYRLPDGRMAVDVTENKTLAAKDCGVVQNVITDGITITLPATSTGLFYNIRNGGDPASGVPAGAAADESMEVTVSPNASDKIMGCELTAADNKDLVNTEATSKIGDELSLVAEGTDGWYVTNMRGTWAREA